MKEKEQRMRRAAMMLNGYYGSHVDGATDTMSKSRERVGERPMTRSPTKRVD